jgi:lysophospholipid acyltransferase (LPLAT)-like uncharacterized protein
MALERKRKFFLNWPKILAALISLYYRLVRLRSFGYPEDRALPVIFSVWHSEEITLLPRFGCTRGNIMISRSKDGDILSEVVKTWNYRVSRGSTNKGAVAALLSLKRALEGGENIILAADGPKGPYHQAKPGAFYLAAKTGRPIYPVGVAVNRAYIFKKSWSLSRLPLPFSKVVAVFGPPFCLEKGDLSLSSSEQTKRLNEVMEAAKLEAEEKLKNRNFSC